MIARHMESPFRRPVQIALVLLLGGLAALAVFTARAGAQELEIEWIQGPGPVELGTGVASLDLQSDFLFAGAQDTRKAMEWMGNPPSDHELGMVVPAAENETWFVVFEHFPIGFVKDDDRDEIDADMLLEQLTASTEESNRLRREMGAEALHITGWAERPHYDPLTHNLVWALRARTESGEEVVNYNVRLLGRRGYTSVTLVTEPALLAAQKPALTEVIGGFSYNQGSRYADFVKGDRVAEIGLAALVAGGAGAAAVKLGLFAWLGKVLAKAWKLVVVVIAAIVAGLKKILAGIFGRRTSTGTYPT